jgi:hypothetical protein
MASMVTTMTRRASQLRATNAQKTADHIAALPYLDACDDSAARRGQLAQAAVGRDPAATADSIHATVAARQTNLVRRGYPPETHRRI